MKSRPRRARGWAVLPWIALLVGLPKPSDAQTPALSPPIGELLDRLRKMEEANRQLAEQVEKIDRKNQALDAQNGRLANENKTLANEFRGISEKLKALEKSSKDGGEEQGGDDPEKTPKRDPGGTPSGDAESAGFAQSGRDAPGQSAQVVGNRHLGKLPIKTRYNHDTFGLQFDTEDDEFELKIRGMIQADSLVYQQSNQDPVSGGFYLPRTRLYFTGHLTRPIEYQLSFQRAFNNLNVLNAYVNFHYDDRFQFRVGRFKTPFIYEYYKFHIWQLLAPERSLFAENFQGGRQLGAMAWGELFDKKLEYAVGVFDGPRRSFTDYNDAKDVYALLNFRPFEGRTGSFLRNLNIGGSVDSGNQNNPLTPAVLRTSANASSTSETADQPINNASVPFLVFNQNVREQGNRTLAELHFAYYFRGLSLLGAWDGGTNDFTLKGQGQRPVHLPVQGYFVQAGYLLTGETINDRTLIDPLRPFDLRRGRFGLGAFEVTGRYSALTLGNEVFTKGLADPNLWTDRADMVDAGLNWYLNKWVKVYFDWEHAMFAQPVAYRPGPSLQKTSDLFWLRLQILF